MIPIASKQQVLRCCVSSRTLKAKSMSRSIRAAPFYRREHFGQDANEFGRRDETTVAENISIGLFAMRSSRHLFFHTLMVLRRSVAVQGAHLTSNVEIVSAPFQSIEHTVHAALLQRETIASTVSSGYLEMVMDFEKVLIGRFAFRTKFRL